MRGLLKLMLWTGIGVGSLVLLGWGIHQIVMPTRAYPAAFPGAHLAIKVNVQIGNCCREDQLTYVTQESIDTLKAHYTNELKHVCINDWYWHEIESFEKGYTHGIRARCIIKNNFFEQYTRVSLLYNSDQPSTFVYQVNTRLSAD